MDIINQNKDVLYTVFTQMGSYKRSKVCTVCKLWNDMGLQCISLIESEAAVRTYLNVTGDDMYKYYHTIVRHAISHRWLGDPLMRMSLCGCDKLYFIKLAHKVNGSMPFWNYSDITRIAIGGYERMFRWVRDNNAGHYQVTDADFEVLSFVLACKLNDCKLTKDMVASSSMWSAIIQYNPCDDIIHTFLDLNAHIGLCDMFIGMGSCNGDMGRDLFTRMVSLIRDEAHWMKDDVDHSKLGVRCGWLDDRLINICQNGNIEAIDDTYAGYSVLMYYVCIVESGYSVSVTTALYDCCCTYGDAQWSYDKMLQMAYEFKDRRMIECVLDCMVVLFARMWGDEVD